MNGYFDLRYRVTTPPWSDELYEKLDKMNLQADSSGDILYVSVAVRKSDVTTGLAALDQGARLIQAAGLEVQRAMPNLVTMAAIASRFNVSRQAVQKWKARTSFPSPEFTDGTQLWEWPLVRQWIQAHTRHTTYDECEYPTLSDCDRFNARLAGPWSHSAGGALSTGFPAIAKYRILNLGGGPETVSVGSMFWTDALKELSSTWVPGVVIENSRDRPVSMRRGNVIGKRNDNLKDRYGIKA